MNKKPTVKNNDAEKILKEWKKGKGDLKVDIKEDSIMFKRDNAMPRPTWTEKQKEDLDIRFGAITDLLKESIALSKEAIQISKEAIKISNESLSLAKETNATLIDHIKNHK